ncbi:MAG TPA: hypothetical protein VHN74_20100 [Candidatus Angelobacter sp.]|jgi:hypothetical protein|nr:hypothetical protein [Candidatus Angelobacter sp.]
MTLRYNTDEIIPLGGIYLVLHEQHRLIRTIRLYAGNRFPRCSQCRDQVRFELAQQMQEVPGDEPIQLYELSLLDEAEEEARDGSGLP